MYHHQSEEFNWWFESFILCYNKFWVSFSLKMANQQFLSSLYAHASPLIQRLTLYFPFPLNLDDLVTFIPSKT